jgi:hypothetical protein
MIVSSAITDPGIREYVNNRVPKLADVHPIVRAMEKHGFVSPARFRQLVHPGTQPYLITANGPNITHQANGHNLQIVPGQTTLQGRTLLWWGFPDPTGTTLNVDPATIAHFDRPAVLSAHASRAGSQRKVFLAGLAILQGMLVDGHFRAGQFDLETVSASWQLFELAVYGNIIDDWDVEIL